MPKMKTKSGAKKRFKITGTGKVKFQQSGKRHGMIKRSTSQIREHRGTKVLFKTDGDNIKKYWMPSGGYQPFATSSKISAGDQSWPASNVASLRTPSTRKP